MFLKEFAVRRYGPLAGGEPKKLGPFTLFFAPNEEGKTLIIDALLKMMFSSRELKPFGGVRRVVEAPEGYLVAGMEKGEVRLPGAGSFSNLFNVSALEFRNVFLIRDSDLTLAGEDEFYRTLTARLTGLRTAEIKTIKENLQELGGITAGGDFLNQAPGKLKEKYTGAQKMLVEIESLLEELNSENFSRLEVDLARLEERRREINSLLESYNAAYNRELFEKGRAALDKLQKARAGVAGLEKFNRNDYEAWQRAISNLDFLRGEAQRLEAEGWENRNRLHQALNRREQQQEELKGLEYTARRAQETIAPALDHYSRRSGEIQREESLLAAPLVSKAAAVSALTFLIALAGTAFGSEWWLFPVLFGSLFLTLAYGLFRFRLERKKAALARSGTEVCAAAQQLDLPSADLKAVRAAWGRLDRDLELGRETLKEKENEVQWLEREYVRLKGELKDREEKIGEEERRIAGISLSTGVETLSRYSERLEEKQALHEEIEKQKGILQSLFTASEEFTGPEETLNYWAEQVKRLEGFAGAAKGLPYDQDAVQKLKEELDLVGVEAEQLSERLTRRGDQLRRFEKEVNELLREQEENHLPCQTTVDLEAARQKVKRWLAEREHDRHKALIAREIYDRIIAEEEQKVSALFGAGKAVSRHFETITGGRYREVLFDSSESRVKVLTGSGAVLEAASLSGGAYDQLYFSIRLALGENLLQGEKGFFILDDPFIKADAGRLKKMLGMLSAICRDGWQVLYFTAKDEIKSALQEEIEADRVRVCMI